MDEFLIALQISLFFPPSLKDLSGSKIFELLIFCNSGVTVFSPFFSFFPIPRGELESGVFKKTRDIGLKRALVQNIIQSFV